MPTRRGSSTGSTSGLWISTPSMWIVPFVTRAPGTRSFIRLKQRSRVDLPQPDGPIRATISRLGTRSEISFSARDLP